MSVRELLGSAASLDKTQASLQSASPRVRYDFVSEHNAVGYVDQAGYEGYALQFADETKGIVELEEVDRWGAELSSVLYTYRSIARAMPTVSGDEATKKKMYAASFEVLDPAIDRVKQLITFRERAISKWTSNLSLLIRAEVRQRSAASTKDVVLPIPCEALYVQLLHTLDGLAVLDALKDTKACLNNDFSTYKRAFQHCQADIGPLAEQKTTENNLLQPLCPWQRLAPRTAALLCRACCAPLTRAHVRSHRVRRLANQQSVLSALRDAVHKMPGHDTVLADMAMLAIEHLESEWWLLPREKHRLLRAAAHTLWLLDAPGANAFAHKRIRRERFARWFRRYPVVPLFGEMFAHLPSILSKCPNWSGGYAEELFEKQSPPGAAHTRTHARCSQGPRCASRAPRTPLRPRCASCGRVWVGGCRRSLPERFERLREESLGRMGKAERGEKLAEAERKALEKLERQVALTLALTPTMPITITLALTATMPVTMPITLTPTMPVTITLTPTMPVTMPITITPTLTSEAPLAGGPRQGAALRPRVRLVHRPAAGAAVGRRRLHVGALEPAPAHRCDGRRRAVRAAARGEDGPRARARRDHAARLPPHVRLRAPHPRCPSTPSGGHSVLGAPLKPLHRAAAGRPSRRSSPRAWPTSAPTRPPTTRWPRAARAASGATTSGRCGTTWPPRSARRSSSSSSCSRGCTPRCTG